MNQRFVSATALLLTLPLGLAQALPDLLPDEPAEDALDGLLDPTRANQPWGFARITTDLAGAEVGGTLVVRGTAEAQQGYALKAVAVWVDNWYMGYANGTTDWTFTLDTRTLVDGGHRLRVVGYATPEVAYFPVLSGSGESVAFSTLNHLPAITLFEKQVRFTGAGAEAWLVRLTQDYTGLRVTLRTEGEGQLAPTAQLVTAYKETEDDDQPPLRTWVSTYGPLSNALTITRAPHPVMEAPGVLSLAGAFAGEGLVHIKVEAVPLRVP